jgi:hypothetical protein
MLGSGAVVVMDETTDAVKACLRLVRFFARESCGKCTPCREGTTWLEKILQRILDGHGRPEDLNLLLDVVRQHLARPLPGGHGLGRAVPAPDHDLPARPVGHVADHLGGPRFRTSSRPRSATGQREVRVKGAAGGSLLPNRGATTEASTGV